MEEGLCITAEKWFASGESNVFRLSRNYFNGLVALLAENIFETWRSYFFIGYER
jgi:hypothetical protein